MNVVPSPSDGRDHLGLVGEDVLVLNHIKDMLVNVVEGCLGVSEENPHCLLWAAGLKMTAALYNEDISVALGVCLRDLLGVCDDYVYLF